MQFAGCSLQRTPKRFVMSRHFMALVLAVLPLPASPFFNGLAPVPLGYMSGRMGRFATRTPTYEGISFSSSSLQTPPRPTILAGYSRTFQPRMEGMKLIIETVANKETTGGFYGEGLYAPLGAGGGYSLMEMLGRGEIPHRHRGNGKSQLKGTLEFQLQETAPGAVDVVLVFFEVGPDDPDNRHPFGPILLSPPEIQDEDYAVYGGGLFGAPPPGGPVAGGLYAALGLYGGLSHVPGDSREPGAESEFGVIARLTLEPGLNSFQIQGLWPFTDITQLAGRGAALCSGVTINSVGQRFCSGQVFAVLRSVKLGYALQEQPLFSTGNGNGNGGS